MSSGHDDVADSTVEHRTTEGPCISCVLAHPLDDDRPKLGTVTWVLRRTGRLTTGVSIKFECPDGHRSDEDPALLKSFRSRLF
jgi:hypothetical protein